MTATMSIALAARASRRRSPWLDFIVRRTVRLLVSLWVLMTASFLMLQLIPGDPVRLALGRSAPAETVQLRREQLGLDDPILLQYWHYFAGIFRGDFGVSMVSGLPVAETVGARLPATLELSLAAFALIVALALPIGTAAAVLTRAGKRPGAELGFVTGSIAVAAIPSFLTATLLITVFAVTLHWFPPAGSGSFIYLVLPAATLAIGPVAVLTRMLRVELLEVLESDFVRTARAKRLPGWKVLFSHALPNASTATLTVGGILFSGLVVGTVLVETIFAWPGLGSSIVEAIQQKDYPMVQAIVLVYGGIVLLINLIVDVLLAAIDPRTLTAGGDN